MRIIFSIMLLLGLILVSMSLARKEHGDITTMFSNRAHVFVPTEQEE